MKENASRRLLTISLFVCTMFLAAVNMSHGALLTEAITWYRLSDAQQGLANSLQSTGFLLALFTSFFLMGRVTKKALLIACACLITLVMVPLPMLPPYWAYALLFLPVGVAFGYLDTLTSAMIADSYQGAKSTKMMCALHAFHGFSGVLAPLALSWVVSATGKWQNAYLALLIAGAAMLLLVIPTVSRFAPPESEKSATARVTPAALKAYFKTRGNAGLMASLFFYGFYLMGMIVWIKRYTEAGLQSGLGALALSSLYLGITASRLLLPVLPISVRAFLRFGNLAAGLVLGAGILYGNAPVLCAAVILSSLLSGAMIPASLSLSCARFAQNTFLASTLSNLFLLTGHIIASPAIGALESVWGLRAAMLLCPLALLIAGAFGFFTPSKEEVTT